MKQQPELVGGRLGAGGTVGSQMQFVRLDQVFGLPARAIDLLVERLGQTPQVGDDEAAVGPLRTGLDAGDDAALYIPAFGGIAEIAIAATFSPSSARRPKAASSVSGLTCRSSTGLPERPKM